MGGSADLVTGMLDAALMHLDPAVDPAGTYLDKVLRVAGVEGFAPDAFQQGGKKVPTYTKYTSKYYDMMRNATIAYNTMRVHNKTEGLSEKEYVELEIERELKLDLYDILKDYEKDIRVINQEINLLYLNRTIKPKQKKHELNKLLAERNKLYMDAVKDAKQYVKEYKDAD
jgi:hypothetical protein